MYKIKLKKSKDKTGGKNAYRKKSKGLLYLIFTLTIIAALTISCKNKPTGTSDFAGFDENMALNGSTLSRDDFTKFIGKTIRSRDPISGNIGYFWAEFSAEGIKFRQGIANII